MGRVYVSLSAADLPIARMQRSSSRSASTRRDSRPAQRGRRSGRPCRSTRRRARRAGSNASPISAPPEQQLLGLGRPRRVGMRYRPLSAGQRVDDVEPAVARRTRVPAAGRSRRRKRSTSPSGETRYSASTSEIVGAGDVQIAVGTERQMEGRDARRQRREDRRRVPSGRRAGSSRIDRRRTASPSGRTRCRRRRRDRWRPASTRPSRVDAVDAAVEPARHVQPAVGDRRRATSAFARSVTNGSRAPSAPTL